MANNDIWSRWLLETRFGGDEERLDDVLSSLIPVRDKVLEHAALAGNETLLDVGSGDGLIAFGALDHLPDGRVIGADIDPDALDHAAAFARASGLVHRCAFVQTDTTTLDGIADESVNVVTTRSVLIYVKDKQATFDSFYRVLAPGGTFSLFEPIHRFNHPEPDHLLFGYDVSPVRDLATKVKAVYAAIQPPDDPMFDFDALDLVRMAQQAGFREVHLELHADVVPLSEYDASGDWDAFMNTAPNPLVPTLGNAMHQALTDDERDMLSAHLRPLVERAGGVSKRAVAYIYGEKHDS